MGNVGSVNDSGIGLSLAKQISSLNEQHTELEQALNKEIGRPMPDADAVKKIKHQKLAIKDELSKLDGQ